MKSYEKNLNNSYEKAANDWKKLQITVEPLLSDWNDRVGRHFQKEYWEEFNRVIPEHMEQLNQLQNEVNSAFDELSNSDYEINGTSIAIILACGTGVIIPATSP